MKFILHELHVWLLREKVLTYLSLFFRTRCIFVDILVLWKYANILNINFNMTLVKSVMLFTLE